MTPPFNPQSPRRLTAYSRFSGALTLAVGALVLVGWALDIPLLKSVLPGVVTMKANTATAFLLAGLSLLLAGQLRPAGRALARITAGLVLLIGLLTLAEYLFNANLGIDQLLFTEPAGAVATSTPGRMAPPTAFNFLLLGIALLVLHGGRNPWPMQLLTIPVVLIAFLAFLGYVYGLQSFYGVATYTKMAVHTSVIFVVLSVGILVARTESGFMAIIVSNSTGGVMARRLLPAVLIVPAVLGWLRLAGERAGLYQAEFGVALFTLGSMAIFAALIGWNARLLVQADAQRQGAEAAVQRAHAELEQRVADRTRELAQVISEIREGINILAGTGGEIVTAASQLSSNAANSATAVMETTTTVEEVRQTAQLSSQKAQSVSGSAQKAAQVSLAGKKSTDEAVAGMQRIRQQMESIADSMVRLSEQTQAISQIIASVDDLAAQSNLLAVNAAIEAAKAGEQGKGFAVVAQEVKSLAEQSKQATNQVRTILHDIQKATSAAVMATEQGSKAVESGVTQSAQAGESILTLTRSVTEAAQAAMQIAASNQQQLIGVEQVASAMEHIKESSAQNVANAKQLETYARSLNALGRKLQELTAHYNREDRPS